MKKVHESIIPIEIFDQVQEEMKRRSDVEVVDGKAKRKSTHYSAKKIERNNWVSDLNHNKFSVQ